MALEEKSHLCIPPKKPERSHFSILIVVNPRERHCDGVSVLHYSITSSYFKHELALEVEVLDES